MCKTLETYIERLKTFLLEDHSSVRGFTRIRDLLEKGEVPELGVFYSGKKYLLHDMVVYSINEENSEFKPVSSKSLYKCIGNAARAVKKISKPPQKINNLIILPFDNKAVEELHNLEKRLNGRGTKTRGYTVRYFSIPLLELATPKDEINIEEYAFISKHNPLHNPPVSKELQDLKRRIIARYRAEKEASERLYAMPKTEESAPTITAP